MNETIQHRTRRYPGLHYFTTEQKDQFFGRDDEKQALLALVMTERIVALFGKSGYGKSSLLRAGLIPELPDDWLPIVVQFGAYQVGQSLTPEARILAQLDAVLPGDVSEMAFLDELSPEDTLWKRFKKKQNAEKRTFLLLFDQFEEFQTYPLEQREAFKKQLAELLFTHIPQSVRDCSDDLPEAEQDLLAFPNKVKALFAIREDRLSVLDSLADKLPGILHKRFHLKGLGDRQATDALVQPALLPQGHLFESPSFQYAPGTVGLIKKGLKKDENDPNIESFLLQICCEDIESTVIKRTQYATGTIVVREDDLPNFGDLFEQYYRNKIAALPDPARRYAASRMIEDQLVKTDPASGIAYRINADGRALCALPGVDEPLLKQLTDFFLLRSEPNTTGGFSYEISHDRLVEGILAMRRAWEVQEAERLRLAEEAAERERLRVQAERQRKEREKIHRARQRNVVFTTMALLLLAWAWRQTGQAQLRSEQAAIAEEKAIKAQTAALEAQQEAETLKGIAESEKHNALTKEAAAKSAEQQARQAQQKAQESAQMVVFNRLRDAHDQIIALDYDAAYRTLLNAEGLGVMPADIGRAMFEVAYWLMESGRFEKANMVANRVAKLLKKSKIGKVYDLNAGRDLLKRLDAAEYNRMYERYYPKMLLVKGNTFDMTENYRVQLSGYRIAETETSYFQFALFCTATNHPLKPHRPSWGFDGRHPAVAVSWYDACLYANWLTKQMGMTQDTVYNLIDQKDSDNDSYSETFTVILRTWAKGFRLPTEAEWQFAAAGGDPNQLTEWAGTSKEDSLRYYMNADGEQDGWKYTAPVKTFWPNRLGFYDMSGNALEWCWDWGGNTGDTKTDKVVENPMGPLQGSLRMFRGGSWYRKVLYCRTTYRDLGNPQIRVGNLGFRLAYSAM